MDQIALSVLSLIAIALTQGNARCRKFAPLFGMSSQPFWLYSTYTAGLFGIFFLSIIYTCVWAFGIYKQWFKKE